MLWLSNSQQFSFLGLFGLIVIILYILFIYTSVKNRKHNFIVLALKSFFVVNGKNNKCLVFINDI